MKEYHDCNILYYFLNEFLSLYYISREPGYTTQRKCAAWIGGSIIASLGTYKQFKITRQEWEENPESCIQTKAL